MANLVLRYSIYSNKSNVDIFEISRKLPLHGIKGVYKLGEIKGKYVSQEHAIDYIYRYQNVTSIKTICEDFYERWNQYKEIIKAIHVDGFKSHLLFEFIIEDFDFPELCYGSDFLSFFSEMSAELQFYFYEAP